MRARRYTVLLAMLVATGTAPVVKAQDAELEAGEPGPEHAAEAEDSGGRSLIMELDHGAAADAGSAPVAPAQPRDMPESDVELIVGGQGKDGIAKRSRLKKEE